MPEVLLAAASPDRNETMPDLLLELFSEEIPARMQARAAEDLCRLVTVALQERGLKHEGAAGFATPRRLALHVSGLPARQPDRHEEKRGPRVGAPEADRDHAKTTKNMSSWLMREYTLLICGCIAG